MKNNGKEAEKAFIDYWTVKGHIQRLRDKGDLMGLNGGKNVADFPKPSDFLVSSRDIPLHYAEVKSTTNADGFSFSKIQKGQSAAALTEQRRGCGKYIFYIFSYPLGLWFIMSCDEYASILNEGRKSVKFKELSPWLK